MPVLRIKGKQIVLAGGFLLVIMAAVYLMFPSLLYSKAQAFEKEGNAAKADSCYNIMEKIFPYAEKTAWVLYIRGVEPLQGSASGAETGKIYIFPTFTCSSGEPVSRTDIEEGINRLKILHSRFPESRWALHALRELGKAYYLLGDDITAKEYLQASINDSNLESAESTMLLAEIFLKQGRNQEALDLAERSLKEKPGLNPLEMNFIKGKALMDMKDWDAARDLFESLPQQAEKIFNTYLKDEEINDLELNMNNWENISRNYLKQIDGLERGTEQTGVITGRVLVGEKVLKGVTVFLLDKSLQQDYHSGMTEYLPRVVTEEDGSFVFSGILPGEYALGIGVELKDITNFTLQELPGSLNVKAGEKISWDIYFRPTVKLENPLGESSVAGKTVFQWQPVSGVEKYDLFIGPVLRDENGRISSVYTSVLKSGIKETKIVVDLEEERKKSRFSGGISYDSEGINPASILGLFYPGEEFTWGVYAYDAKGQRISDSNGYGFYRKEKDLPVFKVGEGNLTQGDRLLLDRKYEEAAAAYEKQIEADPKDLDALAALARYYHFGPRMGTADPEKAVEYYRRILEIMDSTEVRKALGEVYLDLGETEHAYEMFYSLVGSAEEDWYTYYKLARIEFIKGSPEKAREFLEQAVDRQNGIYTRAFPVVLSLLFDDPAQAIGYARKVDGGGDYLELLMSYRDDKYSLCPEVKNAVLSGEYDTAFAALGDTEFDNFVRGLLLFALGDSDYQDELKNIYKSMEKGLLKELFQKLLM